MNFRTIFFKLTFLLLVIVLSGCGSGGDSATTTINNPTDNTIQKGTVPSKYYGSWKYAHDGSEIYITSSTVLDFSEVDENQLKVNDNGNTKYLIRNGVENVNISGNVYDKSGLTASTVLASSNYKRGSSRIGGINVVLENIKDKKIKTNITTEDNGVFMDNTLPAGTYNITAEKDGLEVKTVVSINDKNTDIGNYFLVDANTNNFKTELILNDKFIYADEQIYNGVVRVHNISNIDGIGLNYTLSLTDENLKSFNYGTVIGTIEAGNYKDIPIHISFNNFLLNEKDIQLNVKIKDVNNNEWNDKLSFKVFRTKLRINFSSEQSNIRGYVTLPNNQQKDINLSGGYIEVPSLIEGDYYIVLSNPDLSQETAYSIGYETEPASLTNFSDTSIYEDTNSNQKGAVEIQKNSAISAYLHVGDIDFYKIQSPKNLNLFSKIFNASLNISYISNQVIITKELLTLGNIVSVTNGVLIINGNIIGQNAVLSLGDELQIKLISSPDYNKSSVATLTLGDYHSDFVVTTYEEDMTVNDFSFQNIIDAIPTINYTSNKISITGTNSILKAVVSNGTLIKNGVELNSSETMVQNNDRLQIKIKASPVYDTTVSSILTIGNYLKDFNVTTRKNLLSPITFAETNTTYSSEKMIIPVDKTIVTINNGVLYKNGIELSTLSTITSLGDEVYIKLRSATDINQISSSFIDLGYTNDFFKITTVPNDYKFIKNGIYSEEDNYYYMNLDKDSNVSISYAFNNNKETFVSIYDKDMNILHKTLSGPVELNKGVYIVHKLYDSSQLKVSSDGLGKTEFYKTVQNKNYSDEWQILQLKQKVANNFLFSENLGNVKIMDQNFKLIVKAASGKVKIPAGDYYIGIQAAPIGAFGEHAPVSIYSSALGSMNNFPNIENDIIYSYDDTFHNGSLMRFETPVETNLTINFHQQTRVEIYDINANLVINTSADYYDHGSIHYSPDSFSGAVINGWSLTIPISAGSYIIKKQSDVSFYSDVLK